MIVTSITEHTAESLCNRSRTRSLKKLSICKFEEDLEIVRNPCGS